MKRFYLVSLAVYTFIFTSHTSCMMLRLIKGSALRPIATHKRFSSTSMLEQRIKMLERNHDLHAKEMTELKAIIATLQSNRQPIPTYETIPNYNHLGTFIEPHNMHYGNTDH